MGEHTRVRLLRCFWVVRSGDSDVEAVMNEQEAEDMEQTEDEKKAGSDGATGSATGRLIHSVVDVPMIIAWSLENQLEKHD